MVGRNLGRPAPRRGHDHGVGTNENSGSRPHNEARAQAAASESKSQFVVVNTTLQGSADAATGSCVAECSAGLHFGLGAGNLPPFA